MLPAIPDSVIYAGLGGCVLALIVATAQQKWELKAFFLLALRLAIGWQFLFEGLYKINTEWVGATETNKVFTSEPYFKASPTALGEKMRKQFSDPSAVIAERLTPKSSLSVQEFAKLSTKDQAALCPDALAKEFDDLKEAAESAVKTEAANVKKDAPEQLKKEFAKIEDEKTIAVAQAQMTLDAQRSAIASRRGEVLAVLEKKPDGELSKIATTRYDDAQKAAEADFAKAKGAAEADAQKKVDAANAAVPKKLKTADENTAKAAAIAAERIEDAKAFFAGWVYGADRRDAKVKFTSGEAALTAPQRLAHIDWLRGELKNAMTVPAMHVGNGNGVDVKRTAELRTELLTAETDLAKDALAGDLKKELIGKDPPAVKVESDGQKLDQFTMWFIASVGACILFGFLTRISCILAAGFLLVTYLTHPPFPWYALPPMTEGNPLFVNKNLIEMLALLVLACYPTGRWLGLDAILALLIPGCRNKNSDLTPGS